MRSFTVPKTKATFVRLRVLTNQCTGTPDYQGDQDDDPLNVTDCEDGSTQDDNVRAAELPGLREVAAIPVVRAGQPAARFRLTE